MCKYTIVVTGSPEVRLRLLMAIKTLHTSAVVLSKVYFYFWYLVTCIIHKSPKTSIDLFVGIILSMMTR